MIDTSAESDEIVNYYNNLNYTDKWVKEVFGMDVDDMYKDEEKLRNLIAFQLEYSLHAAPKDDTFFKVKTAQIAVYEEDPSKEIANDFMCFAELLTSTDMSWTSWNYYQSVPDWEHKKSKGTAARHTLKSRFTGDKHHRYQPADDSEGMILYKRMTKWFQEFKKHEDFVVKARVICNEIAKDMKLLPTWTEDSGPKKSIKKRVVEDDNAEAPEVDFSDDDEGIDGMCFGDILGRTMSRTGVSTRTVDETEENEELEHDE